MAASFVSCSGPIPSIEHSYGWGADFLSSAAGLRIQIGFADEVTAAAATVQPAVAAEGDPHAQAALNESAAAALRGRIGATGRGLRC